MFISTFLAGTRETDRKSRARKYAHQTAIIENIEMSQEALRDGQYLKASAFAMNALARSAFLAGGDI